MSDATLSNGLRSGFFSGLLNDRGFEGRNLFKGDSAFTKLPASFDEENKSGATVDDGAVQNLKGFAFSVKSISSNRKDPTKTVSYDFMTKSNLYGDKWQTDSYKFDLTPGKQKFVYTMPNVDASYKGKVNVYVYAVYPFVMEKFYK